MKMAKTRLGLLINQAIDLCNTCQWRVVPLG